MSKPDESLKDLEREVTCPLCLETFEDPRVLPCQHIYCKNCLDVMASRSRGAHLLCPECRHEVALVGGRVTGLPTAFQINRLKELVAKLVLQKEDGGVEAVETDCPVPNVPANVRSVADASSYLQGKVTATTCSRHQGQSLDLYCRHCEEVVCRDCLLFDQKHSNHSYDKIEAVASSCREEVKEQLASLLEKRPAMLEAMENVERGRRSVQEDRKVVSVKIAESFDQVVGRIEVLKARELQKLQGEAESKLQEFASHESALNRAVLEVKAVQSFVERGVNNLADVEFLSRKKGMLAKIKQMHIHVVNLPLEKLKVGLPAQVVANGCDEEVGLVCERYLQPYTATDPQKSTASLNPLPASVQVGQTAIASILLRDSKGEPCAFQQCISAELHSSRFNHTIAATITVQSPSRYQAHFVPSVSTRGRCELTIKVNGHLIGSNPIKIFVECPPQLLDQPVHIINDIQRPGCLKIINNRMFSRTSAGICSLNLNNISAPPSPCSMFPSDGKLERWWPSEMAINASLSVLYISDPINSSVHKFTTEGGYLMSTNTRRLTTPNGLCVSADGRLFVCDSDNHTIHIFTKDLQWIKSFGTLGSGPGQMNWPDTIDFDSDGQLYLADNNNHRIQCFSNDLKPKWCRGREGKGPGDLKRPNILQVVESYIYVTDDSGVSVFTTGGNFLNRFASVCAATEGTDCIDGIAVDGNGYVYVSDTPRNRIVVF